MFDETVAIISLANEKAGFLEAIKSVSKMAQKTGHPVEAETLDRVFEKLVAEYDRRWKQ